MKKNHLILLSAFTLLVSSCASQKRAQEHIDKEIKQVEKNPPESANDLVRETINNSDKFTSEQKTKLLLLHEKTFNSAADIKEELENARIVLIQTALEPKMNYREYNIIRKKIMKLEKQKLDITFRAITDARDIIEPNRDDKNREFYRAFMHKHIMDY